MYKVEIIKNNIVTHGTHKPTRQECEAWYAENLSAFGKVDRWVSESELAKENEDVTQAVEEMTEPVLGVNVKLYKFLANHSVSYTDITAQLLAAKEKKEALELLLKTDWYVIRKSETGVEIPAEVTTLRAAARLKA